MSVRLTESCWQPLNNPHAMQWWYFALFCDDGQLLRGRIWTRGPPGPGQTCGADLDGYPTDEPSWSLQRRYGHDAFHGERRHLRVMAESSSLVLRAGRLDLDLRLDDTLLHVEAAARQPAAIPAIHHPVNRAHSFLWTVPALRSPFQGRLSRGAVAREIRGTLFLDHVRADVGPSWDWIRNYRGWCWGLWYGEEESLLFLQVDFLRDPVYRAVTVRGDQVRAQRLDRDSCPVRLLGDKPPRFSLVREGREEAVRLTRLHPKRHMALGGRLHQRIVASLPGLRKFHGLGEAHSGSFFFELLRVW